MYCPYCFSSLDAGLMVCRNAGCDLHNQPTPQRAARLFSRLPDKLRIRGGSLMADHGSKCDSCGCECVPVCDACGKDIPATWTRYPRRSVLLLGTNGVGKSTLLATTKTTLTQRQDLTVTPLEIEATAERFYDQYAQPLWINNDHVPHTQPTLPLPFLWGIAHRAALGPASTLALAVYDVPGEMLIRHSAIEPIEPLLSRADAVVLVLNPATFPALYERCGKQAGLAPAPDAWERAERIVDELLKHCGIGKKSSISVSVVYTHLDVWFSALSDCPSTSYLTNEYLRRLTENWHGASFLSRLGEFRQSRFFATGIYRGDTFRPLDGADGPLSYLLRSFGIPIKTQTD